MTLNLFSKSFISLCLCFSAGAGLPALPVNSPEAYAAITGSSFCFAHTRALNVERQPPSYLVLHLKVRVAYRNTGSRPLIMPLGRDLTVYTALKPGIMKIFPQPRNFPDDQSPVLMKDLPADVNPENPLDPHNDVFSIIPPGGLLISAIEDDIVLPVNHKTLFRHDPDLRGRRLYIRLQYDHQEISPALEAQLSDRWSSFGVPWTGMLRTNTVIFDVPTNPTGAPCSDTRVPERFNGHLQAGNNR